MPVTTIAAFTLDRNGWVPNNPHLPVLLYSGAFPLQMTNCAAATCEAIFQCNGWPPQWRDSVYDFHHYHSTAHEVLGCARGAGLLMLGGPGGRAVRIGAGDAILLPAGTGHCLVDANDDFLVVGAYPPGQRFDLCRTAPTPAMARKIATLGFPDSDPIEGWGGALVAHWHHLH